MLRHQHTFKFLVFLVIFTLPRFVPIHRIMIKDVNFSKKTKYDLKPLCSIDIVVCFFKHCFYCIHYWITKKEGKYG